MAKIPFVPLGSGFQTQAQLNVIIQEIVDSLNDDVLYRNNPAGEPNQMLNALDMNSYKVLTYGITRQPKEMF